MDLRPNPEPVEETEDFPVLYFTNTPGKCQVIILNQESGEQLLLPEDGVILVLLNQEAAENVRDDILVPSIFPETLD